MLVCVSGPSGEDFPEADVHAGDVWQEEGQPEETSSQTDQARTAGSPQAWGLHQNPSQLTWSVSGSDEKFKKYYNVNMRNNESEMFVF